MIWMCRLMFCGVMCHASRRPAGQGRTKGTRTIPLGAEARHGPCTGTWWCTATCWSRGFFPCLWASWGEAHGKHVASNGKHVASKLNDYINMFLFYYYILLYCIVMFCFVLYCSINTKCAILTTVVVCCMISVMCNVFLMLCNVIVCCSLYTWCNQYSGSLICSFFVAIRYVSSFILPLSISFLLFFFFAVYLAVDDFVSCWRCFCCCFVRVSFDVVIISVFCVYAPVCWVRCQLQWGARFGRWNCFPC